MPMRNVLIITAYILAAVAGFAETETVPVDQVVQGLLTGQPSTFAEELALCEALLELGPDAVVALCRRLEAGGNDARARTGLQSLAMTVRRHGFSAQRSLFTGAVAEALVAAPDTTVQAFLIALLHGAGDDESVDVLARYVTDDRLCDPAVRALTAIGTPRAVDALVEALADEDAVDRIALIQALGTLRAGQAAEEIARYAEGADPALRKSAQRALAEIGYAPAGALIADALAVTTGQAAAQAGSNYLLLARRLAEQGETGQATAMCRRLLAEDPWPTHLRAGALETLISVLGQGALEDLLAAATAEDPVLQAASVTLAEPMEGPDVTRSWTALLAEADAALAGRIVSMLGRRGDVAALPALVGLLAHADAAVAVEAMTALARLDPAAAVDEILALLTQDQQPERIAAGVDVLMRLPGDSVLQAVAQALSAMPPASRAKLIEGLGDRRATPHARAVLTQAADADEGVRRAAIRALALCITPEELQDAMALMLATSASAERSGLQRAVIAAAMQHPDPELRAGPVLDRLRATEGADRVILLRTLGQLGGTAALEVVMGMIGSVEPDIKEAAIRALADWPDAAAVDGLIGVVRTEELRYQVIALRSALRLMQESDLPDRGKVQRARQALRATTRTEEKEAILAFLSQIRIPRSLRLAARHLDGEAGEAAAVAVARIALPGEDGQAGLEGDLAFDALTRAAPRLTDEALKQRVTDYLETLVPPAGEAEDPCGEGEDAGEEHQE